jgi:hypothetical protein
MIGASWIRKFQINMVEKARTQVRQSISSWRERGKASQPQRKNVSNCFLMCTEILNSHENLPLCLLVTCIRQTSLQSLNCTINVITLGVSLEFVSQWLEFQIASEIHTTLTPMWPKRMYLAAISLCRPPAKITPFFKRLGSNSGALTFSGR